MPLVFFIPVFGFGCLLILEWETRKGKETGKEAGIEKLKINDEIHRSILMEEEPAHDLIVPLQEALLINDASTRRQLIMDILYHDTGEYVEALNRARMNDDVEVVHYATTAMVELQKDYEEKLRKQRLDWERKKDSPALYAAYRQTLEAYVDSGILEGNMKRNRLLEFGRAFDIWARPGRKYGGRRAVSLQKTFREFPFPGGICGFAGVRRPCHGKMAPDGGWLSHAYPVGHPEKGAEADPADAPADRRKKDLPFPQSAENGGILEGR